MSYGTNAPFGLQATRTLISGTFNGQTSTYLIASGYANNIFRGDPVVVCGAGDIPATPGFLISIYDVAGNAFATAATFGVFQGCSYITPTSTNPIDPASPGRPYWPAGTRTLGDVPATAFVVDDPNVIYNIQTTNNPGINQNMVGAVGTYAIPVTSGVVQGNFITGDSSVGFTTGVSPGTRPGTATGAVSTENVIIMRIIPSPPNPPSANPLIPGGNAFNNVEVLINYHQFALRAVART